MRRRGRGRSLTGTASVLLWPQGHIPGAPGRLLLRSSGWAGSLACAPARPVRGRPSPPRRRQLRPRPRGPRRAAASGRGRGGERGPPPSAQTHSAFPESPKRAPRFPLGRGLTEQLALAAKSLGFATEAASASSTVKWGQTQPLCGAETKGLLGNRGFLALLESSVSHLSLSSIRDGAALSTLVPQVPGKVPGT